MRAQSYCRDHGNKVEKENDIHEPLSRHGCVADHLVIVPGSGIARPKKESGTHQEPKAAVNALFCPGGGEHGDARDQHEQKISNVENSGKRRAARERERHQGERQGDSAGEHKPAIPLEQTHPLPL